MEELYKIGVRNVMIPVEDTPFLEENAGCAEFLKKLSLRAHAWVVNNAEEMKVVGVVTEHDMLHSMIPPTHKKERMFGTPRAEIFCLKDSLVRDLMTHNPVVCSPEETVADALKKFSSFDIRRLAVVNERGRLLGEITIQRLARHLRHKLADTV